MRITLLQGLLGREAFQALVLVVVVVILVIVRQLRVRGHLRSAAMLSAVALSTVLAVALWLTLRPIMPPGHAARNLILDPVAGAWGWERIAWNPIIDNLVLFVPVGALATAVFWRRSAVFVWAGCVGLSLAIEFAQFVVPTGRVANAADVLANAAGALIGVMIAVVLRAPETVPARSRQGRDVDRRDARDVARR